MRPQLNPVLVAWINAQSSTAEMRAITQAEISLGTALLPDGKRRAVYPSTRRQPSTLASLVTERRRIGRPITTQDAHIAAMTLANDMPLATRNTDEFKAIPGLAPVDPWKDI
jgi:predicted nucleic acid-binding protein